MRTSLRSTLVLALLTLGAVPAQATTFYVSLLGSDANSCGTATTTTQANNKLTVKAGVACATNPGDIVYIRGGTYTGSGAVIDTETSTVGSGSVGNPIIVGGYTGETAILQPPFNVSCVRFYRVKSYVTIQDLTCDMVNTTAGSSAEGILVYLADHITFERIDLKNGFGFGVHVGNDTPFVTIRDSHIHHFGSASSAPGDGHGLYLTGNDGLYENNEVDHNGGYGFHVYNNSGPHTDPSRNIVRNNRVHDNGLTTLATAYGVVVGWGDGNKVYNNLIYDNQGGAQLYTDGTNTLFANNTIFSNTNVAVALQYYGAGVVARNNIVYGNGSDIVDYGTGSGATVTIDHNLFSNPYFSNEGAFDFTLQTSSGALNVGATIADVTTDFAGTTRPQGGIYDIGAYERAAAGVCGCTP